MSYALENALFQWEEGDRRVRDAPHLDRPVEAVLFELRKRLGSTFTVNELAGFYAEGIDWAQELALANGAGVDSSWTVDAAFARYARQASNFAGGRARQARR